MTVICASARELPAAAQLACRLWEGHTPEELLREFTAQTASGKSAIFVACNDTHDVCIDSQAVVGFAQCTLRHDYVEGTESAPVGYLEGIYVEASCRRTGCAAALLAACESWAREQGCTEFASDCALDNADSLAFHLHTGFTEANRIICFVKPLS